MDTRSASRSVTRNAPKAVAHRVSAAHPQVLHTKSTANPAVRDFSRRESATCPHDFERSRRTRDSFDFPPSSPGFRVVETPHFHAMRTPIAPRLDSHPSDSDGGVTATSEDPFPERRHSLEPSALSESSRRASDLSATNGSDRCASVRVSQPLHRARNALTARLARDPVPPGSHQLWLEPDPAPLPRTPTGSGSSFHWSTSGRARQRTLHAGRQG